MRTLLAFILAYPRRSVVMLLALLVAGIAEGLSLTTLLPLLATAMGGDTASGVGKTITEALLRAGIEPSITIMLLIIVAGMTLKSMLLLLANRQVGYTVAHVATALRLELIDALLASRWEYYLRQPAGSLANSVATEAYRAATGFQYGASVLAFAVQVIIYAVVALFVSWQATVVSLIVGLIFSAALLRLVRASRRAGAGQTRLLRALLAYLSDVLGSVKPLKAMARDNVADAILRDQNAQLETAMRQEVMSKETLRALQEPMLAALAATGLYLALVRWQMSMPEVMMLVFLLVRVLGLLNKVQRQYQHLIAQESAYWALRNAASAARGAAERAAGSIEPQLQRGIELRDVHFRYGSKEVFHGLRLHIPAGSFTAVFGPSGVGKSTLLDLLCGLVEPASGQVLVDGISLHEINLRGWRRMIGYVSQETILLHDTILANVLVGETGLDAADAERALKDAGAWDFVAALPEGMHTVIGERGGLLSGGQRQRIAIARALAHRPRLLILDEPTSALDPDSERMICESLRTLSGQLTIIAVSHRTAVSAAAGRVFRLVDGKAMEMTGGPTRTASTRDAGGPSAISSG